MEGTVVAVCTSEKKGMRKKPQDHVVLRTEWGIEGDAHAEHWHRQVSLLAEESIGKMVEKGLHVGPGSFAENLTTRGMDLLALPLGSRIAIGEQVVLEITQHGKICHDRCAIYKLAGDCVMPREGIFARVVSGGPVHTGDPIRVVAHSELMSPDSGPQSPAPAS
jgi:MOSC domain-containing protein YiiM